MPSSARRITCPCCSAMPTAFPWCWWPLADLPWCTPVGTIDVVPECERAGQIRVEYKKSAVMGDIIYPKMAVEEQRKIVELCDAEGNPYAVVEFKEK